MDMSAQLADLLGDEQRVFTSGEELGRHGHGYDYHPPHSRTQSSIQRTMGKSCAYYASPTRTESRLYHSVRAAVWRGMSPQCEVGYALIRA